MGRRVFRFGRGKGEGLMWFNVAAPTPTPIHVVVQAPGGTSWPTIVFGGLLSALIGAAVSYVVARATMRHNTRNRNEDKRHRLGDMFVTALGEFGSAIVRQDDHECELAINRVGAALPILSVPYGVEYPEFVTWLTGETRSILATIKEKGGLRDMADDDHRELISRSTELQVWCVQWVNEPDDWAALRERVKTRREKSSPTIP